MPPSVPSLLPDRPTHFPIDPSLSSARVGLRERPQFLLRPSHWCQPAACQVDLLRPRPHRGGSRSSQSMAVWLSAKA